MRTDKIILNKAEAAWFSRNVLKTLTILSARAKKNPSVLKRVTYRVLQHLQPKAAEIEACLKQLGEEPFEVELIIKKKPRSVVATLVANTAGILETQILPKYEERNEVDYAKETKVKIEMLKTMGRKFQ